MIKARNKNMLLVKKIIAIILCGISELAIGFQLRHPRMCMGTFGLWKSVHKITGVPLVSWITVLIVMLFAIAGIALIALSVWTDNKYGTLKIAYILYLINTVLLLIGTILSYALNEVNKKTKGIEISVIVLAIALLIFAFVMIAFIQRERKGEMISYTIHLALIVVIMGMFVTSGMFGYEKLSMGKVTEVVPQSSTWLTTKIQGAIRGFIVLFPYLTIFVIENFTISPFGEEDE